MNSLWLTDTQKIGAIFCAGGLFFFGAGMVMFFDRAMLSMGNILFLIGLGIIVGIQKTFLLFARRHVWRGTAAFVVGVTLILLRWAFVGFALELYGLFVLFGDFLTSIAGFIGSVPIVGPYVANFLRYVRGPPSNRDMPV